MKLEDTKGVIRIGKSTKDSQRNGQKRTKDKHLEYTTQETKIEQHKPH